ncbi:hypothetical protein ACIRP7_27155 [Streptomyces sp. NPDC102270]|uniref:hypothetical protein n=1 Tax=Streptomyces sp. NPDC102270 TaxID=3366150 RepID=UPI0037F7AAA7
MYAVLPYWWQENGDAQMSVNADYLNKNFPDQGLLGVRPARAATTIRPGLRATGSLDVSGISTAPDTVSRTLPP